MSFLKRLSRGLMTTEPALARGQADCRAYAVGDVHGRLDLLEVILRRIEEDMAARRSKKTFIVFLGDLIDRGPDSAGVVERLRTYRPEGARMVFLAGNHEEVLLRILHGELGILPSWLMFGGSECAQSYGLDGNALKHVAEGDAIARLRAEIPQSHKDFLESFSDTFRFGDYLFVHAGIRPGVALDAQDKSDLRWIREPFLTDLNEHGFVVVHGHTIVEAVEERPNRIGIDTGAYQSGVLTALAIEDNHRWFLSTSSGSRSSAPAITAAA